MSNTREYFVGTAREPYEYGPYKTNQDAKEALNEHKFQHEEPLYVTNTDDAY